MRMVSARMLRHGLNLWPPILFAGIRVAALADDFRSARVELRIRPWNRNYVGTHFGGSLFAMTDPFWMLLVLHALGDGYIVWDKAATIEFEKPGRGMVHADFALEDATLDALRAAAADGGKVLRWFDAPVRDASGDVVAMVRKQLYVRRKRPKD
jgi:acyl-coenzyme A thioesterase PaaI-like protein